MDVDCEFVLHSITDSAKYNLPDTLFLGNLRSTTEYSCTVILGKGSTADVMLATDKANRRVYAMKCLKPLKQGCAIPKQVFREINLLKSINNEHIIKLHEVVIGVTPNLICLVMEYCPISIATLIDHCPSEGLGVPQIKVIAQHLLRGLHYLDVNYIIHRDITPKNLLVSSNGVLKIADLGSGRRFLYPERATTPHVTTLWYQAPEIVLEASSYGTPVDLWAAGCVICELFKRRPMFEGDGQLRLLKLFTEVLGTPNASSWPDMNKCRQTKNVRFNMQHYSKLPEVLTEFGAGDATELISHLLVYDPNKRYTAEEALDDAWFQRSPRPSKKIELPPDNSPFYVNHSSSPKNK